MCMCTRAPKPTATSTHTRARTHTSSCQGLYPGVNILPFIFHSQSALDRFALESDAPQQPADADGQIVSLSRWLPLDVILPILLDLVLYDCPSLVCQVSFRCHTKGSVTSLCLGCCIFGHVFFFLLGIPFCQGLNFWAFVFEQKAKSIPQYQCSVLCLCFP